MNIYDQPRDLISSVEGVNLVEMEHHGEDALCCGVSSMMSCNEDSRALRVQRFDEVRATGADIMLTSCPKCVSHFECLKFEGDEKYADIESSSQLILEETMQNLIKKIKSPGNNNMYVLAPTPQTTVHEQHAHP